MMGNQEEWLPCAVEAYISEKSCLGEGVSQYSVASAAFGPVGKAQRVTFTTPCNTLAALPETQIR